MSLPCLHSFHSKCVADWLKRSVTCPCCNHDVAKTLRGARAERRAQAAARLDAFAHSFGVDSDDESGADLDDEDDLDDSAEVPGDY